MSTMLAPLPRGVLTRRDDPNTPADERLHDNLSRDVGVAGNTVNWPVLSLFEGKVVTAGTYAGYGLAVRVEGEITLTHAQIAKAHAPWPLAKLANGNFDPLVLPVRCLYGHHNELWVSAGEIVTVFHPLGGMGNTGQSEGNHVHVKLRLLDLKEPECFVDPLPLFLYTT